MPHTVMEITSMLNDSHLEAVESLMKACRMAGYDGVDYPVNDDNSRHFFLWTNVCSQPDAILAGALAMLPVSCESAECIAIVHPEYRRMGYFSQLLAAADNDFSDMEFFFPIKNPDRPTLDALFAIGAEFDRTELKMEKTLNAPSAGLMVTPADSFPPLPSKIPETFEWPPAPARAAASLRIAQTAPDTVCLYDINVKPHMRGKGYAAKMLSALFDELADAGIHTVLIHVSESNVPAVSLYKKTGFQITETLSYYVF